MTMTDHVQIAITVDNVGIARAGFGVPLILSHNATFPERIRWYTSIAGVTADFAVASSPERRAAAQLFAQSPRPSRIAIGRAALKPTQLYSVSVAAVRNSYKYQIKVKGQGFADTTVEFTSDANATDAEIAAGLVTALNAVASRNYTAAGAASPITLTGNASGNWFSAEVVSVDDLSIAQTHADPGVATDLAAIALASNDWYCLLTLYNSELLVNAAAAWVEANGKIYVPDTNDSASITAAATGGDVLDDIRAAGYTRVLGMYHPSPAAFLAASTMGRWLPTEPGKATVKFKTLAAIDPVALTATHKTNLRAKRGNTYETVAGRPITWEGTVGSTVYGYLDVRRDVDWLEDELGKAILGVMAGADKVPYTPEGIAMIEGATRGSVALSVTQGVMAEGTTAVEAPEFVAVQPADKAARQLRNVKFSGVLAGAIHSVIPVNGNVSF